MSEVEVFDDVGGRVLNNNLFTLPRIVETVFGLSRECKTAASVYLVENFENHIWGINSKVEEGFVVKGDGFNPFVGLELSPKFGFFYDSEQELGLKRGLTRSITLDAKSVTFPGSLNRGNATVKSSPFFP